MLAVFDKNVAKSPEALQIHEGDGSVSALKDGFLVNHFSSVYPSAVKINFGSSGLIGCSLDKQNPRLPRLFAVMDDMFCIFQGHIENITFLKQQYGLTKTSTEVTVVIEAYRTLRDRGPYSADQVVRDFHGKFAFLLFDCSTKNVFLAGDTEGSVPIFWGTDAEGDLVLSDDVETVKKSCGKSSSPFPKGCFFTSSGGLRSYEYPLNELKPEPIVDSSGEVCGVTFKVDSEAAKKEMPRVGSVQNWSQQI
ncbi:unnamed protein product [Cochlearia groenlandica]